MEILDRYKEIIGSVENPLVLELGACDGYHSLIMLDILKDSGKEYIYHLFEPNKDLHQSILGRIGHYIKSGDNVKLFKEAIGSSDGYMKFYKSGGQKIEDGVIKENYYGSSSIRKPKLVLEAWKEMTFEEDLVSVITLDSYIIREGIQDRVIDFIWADIQGAEVDLINGGKQYFENVRYLYTEYANSEFYEGEIDKNGIISMLPNFDVVEDYGGDILLINKKLNFK